MQWNKPGRRSTNPSCRGNKSRRLQVQCSRIKVHEFSRMKLLLALLTLFCLSASSQENCVRKPGNPLEHLPSNIEILTHFGERADISPDNQRVAFMAKSFGDAMLIDLKTRVITCLTCNLPGAA